MSGGPAGLALDHLTVTDTTPSELVEVAAAVGARAVCLFMEPMAVLPRMPQFEFYGDTAERRATRERMRDLGVGVDLVYPFTLAGRTEPASFARALETAAYLEAGAVNVLMYDRDPARRLDTFGRFCDLAASHGLKVAIEFYPQSQVRSLAEGLAVLHQVGRPGQVGLNVDLLHLVRAGETAADVAAAPPGSLFYAQYCDGAADCPADRREFEASSQRLLPGQGVFDLAAFAAALPAGVPASVELPQDAALALGVPQLERARQAMDLSRRAIGG
jgi:sugar phosphate isomerase/epimerase